MLGTQYEPVSNSRDPIVNSRDQNLVPKHLKKTDDIIKVVNKLTYLFL